MSLLTSGASARPPITAPSRAGRARKALVGTLTCALASGGAAIGLAAPAQAATTYGFVATVSVGTAMNDSLAIDSEHGSVFVVHGSTNRVSVIDTTTRTVKASIPVGAAPQRVAVDEGLDRAYVTNYDSNSISVIDTATNTVVSTIGGFDRPRGIAVDPTTHKLYVALFFGGEVMTIVDPTTTPMTRTSTTYLGSRPWAVDVDPTTHRAYPTTLFGGTLSTVSGSTILHTLTAFGGPAQVTVDPVTKRAYVAHSGGMAEVDISADTAVVSRHLTAGTQPSDLAIDTAARVLYVTNFGSDNVSVIDQATNTLLTTLPAGNEPVAVEVDPRTRRAYVVNNDGSMTVLGSTSTQAITFTSTPPAQPVAGTTYAVTATGGDSGQPVTFSTASGACTVTPSGQVTFTHVGDCTLSADQVGSVSHTAAPTVDQSMTVGQGSQAITFAPAPTTTTVGGSHTAVATGGGSTQPVTLSVHPSTTAAACSVSGTTVSHDHAGTCVLAADQDGDADYTAAPQATQSFTVSLEPTTAAVDLDDSSVVFGEDASATAEVGPTHDGSVQFTVDGDPVGSGVPVASDGTATSPALTGLAVGAHQVGAVFSPTDDNRYASSVATAQTLTVDKAATTTALTVTGSDLTAEVAPVAPGAGEAGGTVRFLVAGVEVGQDTLHDGVATLDHEVPAGSTRQVAAVYDGDGSFTGSSASTARQDPTVTTSTTSPRAPRNGWYSSPVTVTFTCTATSGALTEPCPAPVTLSRDGAAQSVTRTVVAADGGATTVVVGGLDIDRSRPTVAVTGVRAGATYFATGPKAGCRAADRLSGVASCTVKRTTRGHQVTYVATATDRAGNASTTRLVARTTKVAVSGAAMKDGRYVVRRGRTYTVLVASATRPRWVNAAPAPRRPSGGHYAFTRVGKDRWALGVTFKRPTRHHALWNFGTRVGGTTTVTTVRVVG